MEIREKNTPVVFHISEKTFVRLVELGLSARPTFKEVCKGLLALKQADDAKALQVLPDGQ